LNSRHWREALFGRRNWEQRSVAGICSEGEVGLDIAMLKCGKECDGCLAAGRGRLRREDWFLEDERGQLAMKLSEAGCYQELVIKLCEGFEKQNAFRLRE
jgi:hypothetical protein